MMIVLLSVLSFLFPCRLDGGVGSGLIFWTSAAALSPPSRAQAFQPPPPRTCICVQFFLTGSIACVFTLLLKPLSCLLAALPTVSVSACAFSSSSAEGEIISESPRPSPTHFPWQQRLWTHQTRPDSSIHPPPIVPLLPYSQTFFVLSHPKRPPPLTDSVSQAHG
jgi:hypothetical protein